MKKAVAIILILIQMGFPLVAQQVYEGIAVRGRSGEFPSEGYYAASNSFARNSLVELRNPSTGSTIEVIIVAGVSDPGLFLILSDEAAAALGVTRSNALSLVASPVAVPGLTSVAGNEDLPFSSDPEVNPSAEFEDPNSFVFDPGSDIPEIANPLLQPDSADDGDADSRREPEQVPPRDTVLSDEVQDLEPGDAFVIVEELETPGIEDLFDEEAMDSVAEEPAVGPAEELTDAAPADGASDASGQRDIAETPAVSDAAAPAVEPTVSRGTRTGLSRGLEDILDDGISAAQPVTGGQARRIPEEIPVYSYGILSALGRIRSGSNAVSPDFSLTSPDYAYWPEEYDADAYDAAVEEEMPPAVAEETPAREEVGDAEPDTSLGMQEAESESISFGADVVPQLPLEDVPEDLAEETLTDEDLSGESPVATRSGDDYASALDDDPAEAWLNRIRELYPDRQLFLPPAGTDLDQPLPRVASDGDEVPAVRLTEAGSPLGAEDTPDASLGVRRAARESLPDDQVPEIGFDFDQDLPSVDLGVSPRPSAGRAIAAGQLPLPEAALDDTVEGDSLRLAAPEERLPGVTSVPLAQYIDPRPNVGLARVAADEALLGALDGPPLPRVAAEATVESPLPSGERSVVPDPEISHEPTEKVYGIEAGILRIGAGDPEIAAGDFPEPGEGGSEAAEEPAAELAAADAEPTVETPIEAPRPEDVIVTLEEADYRSPSLRSPDELLGRTDAEEETVEAALDEPADAIAGDSLYTGDLLVFLEEGEARAPVAEEPADEGPSPVETAPVIPVSAEVPGIEWARDNLPLVYTLQPEGYYLQVGAFTNPRSAKRVIDEVAPGYPLAVQPVDGADRQIYRVYVGPLEEDEKGMVLYWFRARGYRDAFIRKGI
jgi:hypothetical protein